MFDANTTILLHGKHLAVAQRMIDFDYLCGKHHPSLVGIISGGSRSTVKLFWGREERLFPVFGSLEDAKETGAHMLINFASHRSAAGVTRDAMDQKWINTICIVAEGIPERETRLLHAHRLQLEATGRTIRLIGPSTVGGIAAGVLRIGHSGGSLDNMIASKLYRPGSVGLLSKSGGMMNELCRVIAQRTDGVHTGIAFGGDRFPLLDIRQRLLDFQANDDISLIVMLDEVGNTDAMVVCNLIREQKLTKPVVMWVTGSFAEQTQQEVQFGHAGAKANHSQEKTSNKLTLLRDTGFHVPESYATLGEMIAQVREETTGQSVGEHDIPAAISTRLQTLQQRRATRFTSSISDERGGELTYNSQPISDLVRDHSLGTVIGHLWLKRSLPDYAARCLQLCLMLLADHGPAVSGAHNTIVTARAGKDLVSSLIAGLATIGPRFGGAIDGAARRLSESVRDQQTAADVIRTHKSRGTLIPGIGHRVRSKYDPDVRCQLLTDFVDDVRTQYPDIVWTHVELAHQVETLTLAKKSNLILNIDGYIAAVWLDIMTAIDIDRQQIQQYIDAGLFNGIFVLARSIGLIGHHLDQYRLGEGLYRTPWDDILYLP